MARVRRRRKTKLPFKYDDFDVVVYAQSAESDSEIDETKSYQEAMRYKERDQWGSASKEEMDSLDRNKTWEIVKRPTKKRVIGCKWVYKNKLSIIGVGDPQLKARLVAKGYS